MPAKKMRKASPRGTKTTGSARGAATKRAPAKKGATAKAATAKHATAKLSTAKGATTRGAMAKQAAPARRPAARKVAPARRAPATMKPASNGRLAAPTGPGRRSDFGLSIDSFFGKQPPNLQEILQVLRELVEEAAPDAEASLKWGMPFYTVGGAMLCALGGHRTHVNLVMAGPPETFADPDGRLAGEGKTGRHLQLRSLEELPRDLVIEWLRAAAELARKKG